MPFNSTCEALGVVLDLSESSSALAKVYNTQSRVAEIKAEIERILDKGWISQVEAQKLRGRMQFADAQIFGRTERGVLVR